MNVISDYNAAVEDSNHIMVLAAAQIGETIGVLAQNQDGKVCAVTDLGRCTLLSQDVTGAGDGVSWSPNWPTKPASGLGLPDAVSVPEEPTDEMLEAAMSDRDRQHPANAKRYLRHVYKTMMQHLPPKKEQGQ